MHIQNHYLASFKASRITCPTLSTSTRKPSWPKGLEMVTKGCADGANSAISACSRGGKRRSVSIQTATTGTLIVANAAATSSAVATDVVAIHSLCEGDVRYSASNLFDSLCA
jgi:hypothetical protein